MPSREHWYLLSDEVLEGLLGRARDGADVETLMIETWSNGQHFEDRDLDHIDLLAENERSIFTFSLSPEGRMDGG